MVIVQVAVDADKLPATVTSTCDFCGRSFCHWLQLNHLAARIVIARPQMIVSTSADGIEYAIALIDAFRCWCRVAVGERPVDHLEAVGTVGA